MAALAFFAVLATVCAVGAIVLTRGAQQQERSRRRQEYERERSHRGWE